MLLAGQPAAADMAALATEQRLSSDDADFGGLSGLIMGPDGASFLAVTDRGHYVRAQIARAAGEVAAVTITAIAPILDSQGVPLDRRNTDAEGFARLQDGAFAISFESNHRIMRHADTDAPGEFLPKHPDFIQLQVNSGLEALAVDGNGTLYAIPERSGASARPFPIYRLRDGVWDTALSAPRRGEFLVTDADIDGGFLYILERYYKPFGGFQSRLRRFFIDRDALRDETVLFESRLGQFDNLEGLDVWRDSTGQLRASMVSDDNFLFYQISEFVEYRLPDPD